MARPSLGDSLSCIFPGAPLPLAPLRIVRSPAWTKLTMSLPADAASLAAGTAVPSALSIASITQAFYRY